MTRPEAVLATTMHLFKILSYVGIVIFSAVALVHWRRAGINPRTPLGLILDWTTVTEFTVGTLIGAVAILAIFSVESLVGFLQTPLVRTPPARTPLVARYRSVSAVNSNVTGWDNFSRAIHYPAPALTGIAIQRGKLLHPWDRTGEEPINGATGIVSVARGRTVHRLTGAPLHRM